MSEHITEPRTYYRVFGALVGLTLLTVVVSFFELGSWHTTVGVAIGVAKALLVVLFFMHLWHAPKLTWLVVLMGLFWFGILIFLTLTDYMARPITSY